MLKTNFDILWMIISSGLVFFMQAGFLCLESGLTRTKNSINVAIKNITDFGIATLVFYSVGFGLMYGESYNGIIGTNFFFPTFSVAERMKFSAYLIVTALISSIIYPVFGHWAWGKNLGEWTSLNGWLNKLGFVDFAGSTVVHSIGGWVGLVALTLIGSREGKYSEDGSIRNITGNNLPIAMLGTLILWFGWIGFNGGSTLSFPGIIANTMLAAAGGMASALIYGWIRLKYAEATLPLNGVLAGLVSITAGCHAVTSFEAMIIGFVAGILMFETRNLLDKLRLDDAVGAIPVHLAGGIWGTLSVGIFGNLDILGTGLSRLEQIQVQLLGIISCAGLAFGISYLILRSINRYYPLRVSQANERQGLNFAEHRATTELSDLFLEMEYQKRTGDLSRNITVEPFTEVGQIAERYNLVLDKIRANIKEKEILTNKLEHNLNIIQSDLSTAKKIQSNILSKNDKTIGDLEISIRYLPLTDVGGDFFDIAELKPGLTRILLADATGHGIQAALITMAIKTIYESVKRGLYSVNEALYHMNNEFLHSFENLNHFFTCILIDVDTNKNKIRYSSAGHPPQFLINGSEIIKMEKTGRMIGVMPQTQYTSKELEFNSTSGLFLFTDGLIEEWNAETEEFGEQRLEQLIQNAGETPIYKLVDTILDEQRKFIGSTAIQDDISIIAISRKK